MTDLSAYMSESIRNIMGHAYLNVLSNPHEARFVARMQKVFIRSERRRKQVLKDDGLEVPPFLIASIATACNLQCKGCYARKNGIANDPGAPQKATLSPLQWQTIFKDASALGVNFCLLAGGEPLTRRDLLETIATVEDIIFPVFTNATLIGPQYIEFFRRHLNIVPIVSLEGDAAATDDRRGKGVYQRALLSMEMLHKEHLFFGTSITVTTENYLAVTSKEYLMQLAAMGCRLVFFVEYVPFDESTQHLAFNDIGPDGAAEPCPFSPFSDSNVAQMGLREALKSPLFSKIRAAKALGWEHTGGCTLFEHRAEVEAMLKEGK